MIDSDIVAYRCAAVNQNAPEGVARWQADQMITRIVEETNASDWKLFLSGDNNFRYNLFPAYKANRKDMVKPRWVESIREHLVSEWGANIADGYEADDSLGIEACVPGRETVICTIDKDLRQVPGNHYHFVNRTWSVVSPLEGWRNFYYQLLVGDATDNIKGCPGIGPIKAAQALRNCTSDQQFYVACSGLFYEVYKDEWFKFLNLNAQLLFIWRKDPDSWTPPLQLELPIKPVVVTVQKSMLKMTDIGMESGVTTEVSGTPVDGIVPMESSSTILEKQD